jgi:predicted dehydrogenase
VIRFGVIGCGAIHKNHCDAILATPGIELTAVCDSDPERAQKAAEAYGCRAFFAPETMWDHVDAVTICAPSGLHAQIGIQAAARGRHLLVEKPIDIHWRRAEELVVACEAAGIKAGCISQHRFAPDVQRLRQAVEDGEFGRILHADMVNKWHRTQAYYDSGDWRGTWALDGGGCLINQGVHYLDLLQWVMGGIEAVTALTRTQARRIEVEDTALALLEFSNGAVGTLTASTVCYPGLIERIEVHGEYGSAIIEGDQFRLWRVDEEGQPQGAYGDGVDRQPAPNISSAEAGGQEGGRQIIWGDQHRLQIADFAAAIRDDRPPFITVRDALEPLKAILAIYESGRRHGHRVLVNEVMH